MNEELDFIVAGAKEKMEQSITHLEKELLNIRAGKANPVMLSMVTIDYYGTMTPLSQVANINTPDARTLSVQPWEKSLLADVEKAILIANLGFTTMNNGESVIISIPPLTEERRKKLVKLAKSETENTKISIRGFRKEANQEVKKSEAIEDLQKNYELDIQELTDRSIKEVDLIFQNKEKEILTV